MKRTLLILLAVVALATCGVAQAKLPDKLRGDEFAESQYAVARSLTADHTQLHPGDEFTLAVQFLPFHRGELKFHIYSDVPAPDGAYVETSLKMVDAANPQKLVAQPGTPPAPAGDNGEVVWAKPVFPAGVPHGDVVKQLWLEGQPVVTVHGKLRAGAAPGMKSFYAIATFMSCTENFCLSPSEVVLKWDLEVVPAGTATAAALTPEQLKAPITFSEDLYSLPPADGGGASPGVEANATSAADPSGSAPAADQTAAAAAPTAPAGSGLPATLRGDEFAESQYAVARSTYADRRQAHPGDEFTLAVQFLPFHRGDVKFHMYSDQPPKEEDAYSPTKLEVVDAVNPQKLLAAQGAPAPAGNNGDAVWDKPVFPAGVAHADQLWLEGQPVVTIHGKLNAQAKPGAKTFYAIVTFTSCTENFCLQPSEVVLKWDMEVVPEGTDAGTVLTADQLQAPLPFSESLYALPGQTPPAVTMKIDTNPPPPAASGSKTINWGNIKTKPGGSMGEIPLWKLLLFSFVGGLILNFMPCVLPVVSIKVISLVRQVEDHPKTVLAHGIAFSLGIIVMFLVAAIVIAIIQAFGTKLGWGSQFQSPVFDIVMAAVIFAFGLSLAGVYTIKPPTAITSAGEHLAEREGLSGSFFKGVLATVLGTPCVGPFLGPALGVAFQRSWFDTIWIFFVVGVGMAVPYLAMLPFIMHMGRRDRGTLSRKLQESRHWLVDFERVMAFLMFGTVAYLLNILLGVTDGQTIICTVAFLIIVGFAAWLWGRMTSSGPRLAPAALALVIVIVLGGGWLSIGRTTAFAMLLGTTPETVPMPIGQGSKDPRMNTNGSASAPTAEPGAQPNPSTKHPGWEDYNRQRLQYLVSHGTSVLVDFTADWCPNCHLNEKVALNTPETKQLRDQLGIVFMVADWTKSDKEITSTINSLGFSSIPLSVIFPASNPNSPIILDGVFGPGELHQKMKQAVGK